MRDQIFKNNMNWLTKNSTAIFEIHRHLSFSCSRNALMISITNEPTTLVNLQQDKMLSCQYIDDIAAEEYASFSKYM